MTLYYTITISPSFTIRMNFYSSSLRRKCYQSCLCEYKSKYEMLTIASFYYMDLCKICMPGRIDGRKGPNPLSFGTTELKSCLYTNDLIHIWFPLISTVILSNLQSTSQNAVSNFKCLIFTRKVEPLRQNDENHFEVV